MVLQIGYQLLCCRGPLGWIGFALKNDAIYFGVIGAGSLTDLVGHLAARLGGPPLEGGLTVHRLCDFEGSDEWSPAQAGFPEASQPVLYSASSSEAKQWVIREFTDSPRDVNGVAGVLAELLLAYFSGQQVDFSVLPVRLDSCREFTRRVLEACRKIPYGKTQSYRELAIAVDQPRAFRAVGQALARNPIPLVIPCHRVISATGKLCGFSAPGGVEIKAKLLAWEQRNIYPLNSR